MSSVNGIRSRTLVLGNLYSFLSCLIHGKKQLPYSSPSPPTSTKRSCPWLNQTIHSRNAKETSPRRRNRKKSWPRKWKHVSRPVNLKTREPLLLQRTLKNSRPRSDHYLVTTRDDGGTKGLEESKKRAKQNARFWAILEGLGESRSESLALRVIPSESTERRSSPSPIQPETSRSIIACVTAPEEEVFGGVISLSAGSLSRHEHLLTQRHFRWGKVDQGPSGVVILRRRGLLRNPKKTFRWGWV